mgnify:CR=1 FL=1
MGQGIDDIHGDAWAYLRYKNSSSWCGYSTCEDCLSHVLYKFYRKSEGVIYAMLRNDVGSWSKTILGKAVGKVNNRWVRIVDYRLLSITPEEPAKRYRLVTDKGRKACYRWEESFLSQFKKDAFISHETVRSLTEDILFLYGVDKKGGMPTIVFHKRGRGGNASRNRICLPNNPSLSITLHEIAHVVTKRIYG